MKIMVMDRIEIMQSIERFLPPAKSWPEFDGVCRIGVIGQVARHVSGYKIGGSNDRLAGLPRNTGYERTVPEYLMETCLHGRKIETVAEKSASHIFNAASPIFFRSARGPSSNNSMVSLKIWLFRAIGLL